MTRIFFIKKVIRVGVLALLAIIVFVLGKRITTANDCSGCSGSGTCRGGVDCSIFKSQK